MILGAGVGSLIAPLVGRSIGNAPLPLLLMGGLFALLGALSLRQSADMARIGAALAINAALAGHPWQIDAHMINFSAVAVTAVLNDLKATLAATGLVAVHHLSLTFLMPGLVFPSLDMAENILCTGLHAVVIIAETVAIAYAILRRQRLGAIGAKQRTELAKTSAQTDAAR